MGLASRDRGFFQAILTTLIAVIVLLILYFKGLTPVVLVLLPIGLTISTRWRLPSGWG